MFMFFLCSPFARLFLFIHFLFFAMQIVNVPADSTSIVFSEGGFFFSALKGAQRSYEPLQSFGVQRIILFTSTA